MSILTDSQREQFDRDGYLVVENVLGPLEDFGPVFAEYAHILDGLAEVLHTQGRIKDTYRDLPLHMRLIKISQETGRTYSQYFDISLPQSGIQPNTPIHVGPGIFRLLTNERLLDIATEFIGPEIYSNPVQHIRMKLPRKVMDQQTPDYLAKPVPWHQDNGVVLPEADETRTLTMWVPLTRATSENGCMQVIPASHTRGLADHCPVSGTVSIPQKALTDAQLDAAVTLPMEPGSVLFMDRHTVHCSLENTTTDQARISLDLRYSPIGEPTGRPDFPGFIARSTSAPHTELRDPAVWAQNWMEARRRLARKSQFAFNRWDGSALVCA